MKSPRGSDLLIILLMLMAFFAYAGCAAGNSGDRVQPDASSISVTGGISEETDPETPNQAATASSADVSTSTDTDPLPSSALPVITDHSFWRLAKQGKVAIPRRIAESLQLGQEWLDETCYDLADFPELDFTGNVSDQSEESQPAATSPIEYYVIHSDLAQPGEIVCRIHYAEIDYTISVPVLDDALSEYLRERGESCVMTYGCHADGSEEVELAFYQDSAYLLVFTDPEGSIPFAGTSYFGRSAGFGSYTTSKELGSLAWGCDIVSVGCFGDGCCSDSTLKILYDQTAWQQMHDRGSEPDTDVCAVVDQLSEFTETSYAASPVQLQTLKDIVAEFEARPLPDRILERFTD